MAEETFYFPSQLFFSFLEMQTDEKSDTGKTSLTCVLSKILVAQTHKSETVRSLHSTSLYSIYEVCSLLNMMSSRKTGFTARLPNSCATRQTRESICIHVLTWEMILDNWTQESHSSPDSPFHSPLLLAGLKERKGKETFLIPQNSKFYSELRVKHSWLNSIPLPFSFCDLPFHFIQFLVLHKLSYSGT